MCDVLEHLPFPRQALHKVRHLLCDGGTLFLSMPNRDCLPWKLMDQTNTNPFVAAVVVGPRRCALTVPALHRYWGELEHYHNFSRAGLYALLAEYGFKPVYYGVSERYRACMEVVAVAIPS